MKTVNTYGSKMAPADICRANGWGVGTVIEGIEDGMVCAIIITAIGERKIMARRVGRDNEGLWSLDGREWSEVKNG